VGYAPNPGQKAMEAVPPNPNLLFRPVNAMLAQKKGLVAAGIQDRVAIAGSTVDDCCRRKICSTILSMSMKILLTFQH
jgi:hypothetical protein